MYFKKEKEFQYHPGIEQIISDVIGGGTIARSDMTGVAFDGIPLDELPPLCIVGQDSKGLWHVVKTAKIYADAAANTVTYKVKKNHLFKAGEVTTKSGLEGIANTISSIDKSNDEYDSVKVASTLGALSEGDVLVLASADADAGDAAYLYEPAALTMNKVKLTVANQQSGLLEAGKVNESVMPFPVDAALKADLNSDGRVIRFV